MIPGLEKAEFARYGVMHRNTYLDSPCLLQSNLALKMKPCVWIAGQLSGVEGYVESAATGLLAAWNVMAAFEGKQAAIAPKNTILGSLQRYITDATVANFQPMNANYGILATTEKKKDKVAASSLEEIRKWKDDYRF